MIASIYQKSHSSFFSLEGISKELEIELSKRQLLKIATVAAACFAMCMFQWGMPIVMSLAIATTMALSALLAEKEIRRAPHLQTDWFNTDHIHWVALTCHLLYRLIAVPAIIIFQASLAVAAPPAQAVALAIQAGYLREILITAILGPITEEILFRGWLQERLEDFFYLLSQLFPISEKAQQHFAACLQAIIFGALHVTGGQVCQSGEKLAVFLGTTFFGWIAGLTKIFDQSLISPILVHSASNTGVALGLASALRVLPLKV